MNSLIIWKILNFPPFLKDSCGDMIFLTVFLFFSLNVLSHYFQACRLSVEKSADNLIEVCLYVTNHFLLQLLDFFFVFDFPQLDYILVCIYLNLSYLDFNFLKLCFSFFTQIWEVFNHYFFIYAFCSILSSSGIPIMPNDGPKSFRLCSLFFFFLLFAPLT